MFVMRMGDEARVCLVIPQGTEMSVALEGRKNDTLMCEPGDDAVDGMGMYEKGGAVLTLCAQLALYDLQSPELTATCLACIARGRV